MATDNGHADDETAIEEPGDRVVAESPVAKFPRASVTIGPFSVFFTNVNRTMKLPGHSHFGLVILHYRTAPGQHGFPAFATTYESVQQRLKALTARPFQDATNEEVVAALWSAFVGWTSPAIERWGGSFSLMKIELAVRGVPDAIGHADGFTTYTVEAE